MNDYIYISDIGLIKIPERNTQQDIFDLYEKVDKHDFIELLSDNITKINNLYVHK